MDSQSHIDALNTRFGIAAKAQVVAGEGGLPMVRITAETASADVYLYGAQVTSWKPAGAEEVLFLSSKSLFEPGRAIRGGIPICLPWFGEKADDPKAPKHGFVRTKEWRLDSLSATDDGSVTLVCVTENDETSRQWWPHEFCAVYRITVGAKLRLELSVINKGSTPMRFEEALHSYLRVGQAKNVRVRGLDNTAYLDKTEKYREKLQTGDIEITSETDRVYLNTQGPVDAVDPELRRTIVTEKKNSDTTVVWNPWVELAASLPDFGDDEWQHMVCVEGSNVQKSAVYLAPGEEHTMRITLSVVPL